MFFGNNDRKILKTSNKERQKGRNKLNIGE